MHYPHFMDEKTEVGGTFKVAALIRGRIRIYIQIDVTTSTIQPLCKRSRMWYVLPHPPVEAYGLFSETSPEARCLTPAWLAVEEPTQPGGVQRASSAPFVLVSQGGEIRCLERLPDRK